MGYFYGDAVFERHFKANSRLIHIIKIRYLFSLCFRFLNNMLPASSNLLLPVIGGVFVK